MKNSTNLINSVKNCYKSLLNLQNPKTYDLYGTFLQNILQRSSKGDKILNKRIILEKMEINSKTYAKITKFDEDNGNLIISANGDNLGSIIYINQIGAQYLKGRIIDILDNKIWDYIPSPYDANHYHHLKNFAMTCYSPAIDKLDNLFIKDHLGFIKEVHLFIRLAGLSNNLYFIVSMKPMFSNRQCALVSEDGLVYANSELFADFLGLKLKSLKDHHIEDLIPDISYKKLPYFEPYFIYPNKNTIAIVRCVVKFKNADIYYVLLVGDSNEIEN